MRARGLLLLLAAVTVAQGAVAGSVTVRSGESLASIASRFDTTVEALLSANGLTGTTVNPGTVLELPAGATPPEHWIVAPGDTLYGIATATGTTVDALVALNDLDGYAIQPGQELRTVAPAAAEPLTVVVGKGDTLWRIARAHDVEPAAIAVANDLGDAAIIHPGDRLVIPGVLASADTPDQGGYAAPTITVDPGDTLWDIARRYDTTVAALMAANRLTAETLRAGQELRIVGGSGLRAAAAMPASSPTPLSSPAPAPSMVWPAHGSLTSRFGWRSLRIGGSHMHYGIDIDGETGDPIRSATAGEVTFAGWMGGFGQLVVVEHDGVEYYYAHASELLVREGQHVAAGDLVARVGSTGRVTGSHLHFEVRVDGSPVDPLPLLETRTAAR